MNENKLRTFRCLSRQSGNLKMKPHFQSEADLLQKRRNDSSPLQIRNAIFVSFIETKGESRPAAAFGTGSGRKKDFSIFDKQTIRRNFKVIQLSGHTGPDIGQGRRLHHPGSD